MSLLYGKPTAFIFDGINSDRYGVSIGYMETSFEIPALERELSTGEYNQYRTSLNHFGLSDEKPLEISFDIFPDYCKDGFNEGWTQSVSRAINNWLQMPTTPRELRFDYSNSSAEDEPSYYYRAVCTSITDIVGAKGIQGKSVKFVCDSSFAYQKVSFIKKNISDGDTFIISNTDDKGEIFPDITLSNLSNGQTIKIVNSESSEYIDIKVNEYSDITKLHIDGSASIVSDQDGKLLPVYKILPSEATYPNIGLRLVNGLNHISVETSETFNIEIGAVFARRMGII